MLSLIAIALISCRFYTYPINVCMHQNYVIMFTNRSIHSHIMSTIWKPRTYIEAARSRGAESIHDELSGAGTCYH